MDAEGGWGAVLDVARLELVGLRTRAVDGTEIDADVDVLAWACRAERLPSQFASVEYMVVAVNER
jgi:hypothetical protein